MEHILSSITVEYNNLLDSYENIYEKFKAIDSSGIDEYINVLDKSRESVMSISNIQHKIDTLRAELKREVHSELIIDSLIDGYSQGKVSYMIDRINYIINYLTSFEQKGKAALEVEMEKLQSDIGVDAKLIKQGIEKYKMNYGAGRGDLIDSIQ